MLHHVIKSLAELGGANINMHFWLYNLMVNPPINAPPSDQIIGGAWWSKYQHVAPPNAFWRSLVEQISKCDPPSAFWLYKLAVNPAINAPPSDQIIIGGAWWSKYQHETPPSAFLAI